MEGLEVAEDSKRVLGSYYRANIECRRGGQYEKCTSPECMKHMDKKAKEWHNAV